MSRPGGGNTGRRKDKEHAEQIREWLEVQRGVEEARSEVAEEIAGVWREHLGELTQGMFDRLPKLAKEWPIDRLVQAMKIAGRKYPPRDDFNAGYAIGQQKYLSGILRKWRAEISGPETAIAPLIEHVAELLRTIQSTIDYQAAVNGTEDMVHLHRPLTTDEAEILAASKTLEAHLDSVDPRWRDL